MIKIYGMPTCPYCDYVHEQIKGREDEFEYIDIGENIRNLSAFMRLRDTQAVFDHLKEIGDVGVPAVLEDEGGDPHVADLLQMVEDGLCVPQPHESAQVSDVLSYVDVLEFVLPSRDLFVDKITVRAGGHPVNSDHLL